MYLYSSGFNRNYLLLNRVVGVFLVLALLFFSVRPFVLFAAEEGTEAQSTEQTTETEEASEEEQETTENIEESTETQEEEQGGAVVETGDATASNEVANVVNTNATDVDVASSGEEEDYSEETSTQETSSSESEGTTSSTETQETTSEDGETTHTETSTEEENSESSTTETTTTHQEVEDGTEEYVHDETTTETEDSSHESTAEETTTETTTEDGHESSEEATTTQESETETETEHSEETTYSDETPEEEEPSTSTTVQTDNNAGVENGLDTVAATGDNTVGAATGGGDAIAVTGNAVATTNLVNVVNTNVVNSDGFLIFMNQLFGTNDLDLNDSFNVFAETENASAGTGCSLDECGDDDTELTVENDNNAEIINDVVLRSTTGGNEVTSEEGTAGVISGNALASANVVNVANTNIVDANYLLLSFNNVGDFFGDIVLPGSSFFDQYFGSGGGVNSDTSVDNNNAADIDNNVSVGASTGENTAVSADGTAVAVTGDAYAAANVVNQTNTNLFNADSFYMLIRVHGDWAGDILGLPAGISWNQTQYGIQLFSTPGYGSTPSTLLPSNLAVTNNNTAAITNNVDVYALTGQNQVDGGAGAYVETGDAHASANIFNVANTNVIGRNWALAVLNIFGDWNGNLSFGRPDLWLGGQALYSGSHALPGGEVIYRFTITNNGDADAHGVSLRVGYEEAFMNFRNYDTRIGGMGAVGWSIGDIPAGETVVVDYPANITGNLPFGQTPLNLTAEVTLSENDANTTDNQEEVVVMAMHHDSYQGGIPIITTPDSNLEISKTNTTDGSIEAGETIGFSIMVTNHDAGPTYHSLLVDTIVDEYGHVVYEQYWDLGQILPNEEITVNYEVFFDEETPLGKYRNNAQVIAVDRHDSLEPFFGRRIETDVASTEVMVVPPPAPVVIASAPIIQSCQQYLFEYLKFGESNDAGEVMKLQRFLNDFEGFSLEITGIYDEATRDAVKEFQRRHAADILDPWGIEEETGYVYYTTRKKINDIWCEGHKKFDLSNEQLEEIALYRRKLELLRREDEPLPDTSNVGYDDTQDTVVATLDEPELEGILPEEEVVVAEEVRDIVELPTPLVTADSQLAVPPQEYDVVRSPFFQGFMKRVETFLLQVRVNTNDDVTLGEDSEAIN